ncbi:hypothetical protein Q604_UNBc4C00101G0001, partial [human gut metagenome]
IIGIEKKFKKSENNDWPMLEILVYYYMSQGESHSWAIQKSIIK